MRTIQDLTAQEFYDLKKSVMAPIYDDHGIAAPSIPPGVDTSDNWVKPKPRPVSMEPAKDQSPYGQMIDHTWGTLEARLDDSLFNNDSAPEWVYRGSTRQMSVYGNITGIMAYFLSGQVMNPDHVAIHPDFGPEVVTLSASYYDLALIATFRIDGGACLELVEGSPRVVVQKFEVGL